VGSGIKGYCCNYLRGDRVYASCHGCRDTRAVFWSLGTGRRNLSRNRGNWPSRFGSRRGFNLIIGILGIIIGLLTFHAPGVTALALVIYIAAWALMIGVTEIALAIKMRREIKGEWLLILMGLASIVFAALLLWNPVAGAAALIWIIAWYAVIIGVLAIIFGFRLRSLPTLRSP
jgi:hypothetical protein